MALIKKIDVEEYFAARRAMRLGRKRRVSQPDAMALIEPTAGVAKAPRSAETLPPGQTSVSVPSTAIPIASHPGRNQLLRPPRSRER